MVNHSCNAPFGFCLVPCQSKDIFPSGFRQSIAVTVKALKPFVLETGKEIVVDYGNECQFDQCLCSSCQSEEMGQTTDEDEVESEEVETTETDSDYTSLTKRRKQLET
jgi:hypothetical protein